jgi:hypothetical protein
MACLKVSAVDNPGNVKLPPPHQQIREDPAIHHVSTNTRRLLGVGTLILSILAVLGLAMIDALSPAGHPAPLASDVYIWQRQWTPAVSAAIAESAGDIQAWRVLALEWDGSGRWRETAFDDAVLQRTGKPVIAVVRIDGQLANWDEAVLLAGITDLLARWERRGIRPAGVEIDHDCATARLPAYARFLALLRAKLAAQENAGADAVRATGGARLALSITALPTWLNSPLLDQVLAQADDVVLQIHAVQDPRFGLFNADQARTWLKQFAARRQTAWRVALPAYGTRVVWNTDGGIAAIESERPVLMGSAQGSELMASPSAIAEFMARIEHSPPRGLAGWVWFRLPTDEDERAWSVSTWRTVVRRSPLRAAVIVNAAPAASTGLHDIQIINEGNADAPLPAALRIDGACLAADGINGYVLERDAKGAWLRREREGLLRAGHRRVVGWVRCNQDKVLAYEQ